MQTKKIVSVPVLLPSAPRVSPVVPQCTVPVLFNSSSESKLYTSNTDLGKLSCLSCSKLNIITVPCVVPSQPSLLSPTAETYVDHVAESSVSTPSTIAPAVEPPVVLSPAFDDSNVAVAETSAPPTAVAETVATDLSSSAEPFVPNLFHPHQYKPDRLDELIQAIAQQFSSSATWGDFIRTVSGRSDLHPIFHTRLHTS